MPCCETPDKCSCCSACVNCDCCKSGTCDKAERPSCTDKCKAEGCKCGKSAACRAACGDAAAGKKCC